MTERTEGEIEIDADPAEVMEVIADFEAYPEWADVESADVLERDDEGRGTAVAYRISMMGFSVAYTLEYRYAPAHAGVAWSTREASGSVKEIEGEYVLEESDAGTRVTYRLSVEPAVPLPGLVRRQAEKRIVRTALEGLKRRVEEG